MTKFRVGSICAFVLAGATIFAQQGPPRAGQPQAPASQPQRGGPPPPLPTLVAEVQGMFKNIETNMLKSADMFPEDKYAWSPTPDVRTWGGLLGHITDDNNGSCFTLSGDPGTRPPNLDNEGVPTAAGKDLKKADIVRLFDESFARCDKAFAAVTADNMLERATPTSRRSKIGALIYDTQHINEHYGNMVTYMRLLHMVPPSSVPAPPGRGRGGN